MSTQTMQWKKTQAGSTEAVEFTDGMLVTAEDLGAAMRYPLSVMQVLLKAYFGCGIVCGLGLTAPKPKKPDATSPERDATGAPVPKRPPECDANFVLVVEKGVALGCDGYPIEICGPLKLDLSFDPCHVPVAARPLLVAARRVTAAEAAARPCGCGASGGESPQQCSRKRDHVLVQAFEADNLPSPLCGKPAPGENGTGGSASEAAVAGKPAGSQTLCACLSECGDCACCGDPWVLLGSVMVGPDGIGEIDLSRRRYVKPIACLCAAEATQSATRREADQPPVPPVANEDGKDKINTITENTPPVIRTDVTPAG